MTNFICSNVLSGEVVPMDATSEIPTWKDLDGLDSRALARFAIGCARRAAAIRHPGPASGVQFILNEVEQYAAGRTVKIPPLSEWASQFRCSAPYLSAAADTVIYACSPAPLGDYLPIVAFRAFAASGCIDEPDFVRAATAELRRHGHAAHELVKHECFGAADCNSQF